MSEKYCQSCCMPMENQTYGTNSDGSKSEDYCSYCYQNGQFTSDITMDEMVELCVPYMTKSEFAMTEDQARNLMKECLPNLKRWKEDQK